MSLPRHIGPLPCVSPISSGLPRVFKTSGIRRRYAVRPIEWYTGAAPQSIGLGETASGLLSVPVHRGETAMHTTFKLVLATVTGASLSLLAAPSAVMANDVPDALSVSGKARSPARSSSKMLRSA